MTISGEEEKAAKVLTLVNNSELLSLRVQHRELDEKIREIQELPYVDQLQLRRMKQKKLQLKDTIQRLKSQLIPDLDA